MSRYGSATRPMPCAASVSGWSLRSWGGIATPQLRFDVGQAMSGNYGQSRLGLAPIPARAHAGIKHAVVGCVRGIVLSTRAELLLIGFGLPGADFAVLGESRRRCLPAIVVVRACGIERGAAGAYEKRRGGKQQQVSVHRLTCQGRILPRWHSDADRT